ncbi:hypothetical protein CMUS01_09437 [Colletotrichum musicola]|uniref:Uncharacterized protein n=1 Tax=Colletotrichum musicola TaxID=2175873 RepID=A0A8H6K7R1_9PEZI|nr:hypothetical protein CMUS01_09437 [Colletotrichum musicola]
MPDINTVSPHPSRRSSSHQMPPPPAPAQASESPSLNILPSNQNTVNNASASNISLPSPTMAPASAAAPPAAPESTSALASGPIRHPRPMTASDLHMELEKEQEAVVNRLTRELQLLRAAHNASVVSNASSTSASNAPDAPPDTHLLSGAAFSTPSVPSNSSRRHHRTASNASTRSQTAVAGSATASVAIPRPPANAAGGGRQDSVASRHSLSSSPAHSLQHLEPGSGMTYFQQQRVPHQQQQTSSTSVAATPGGSEAQLSPGLMSVTSRYEETALHRQELEAAKKENEALKQRIRELEKMVREKGRQRSGSAGSSAATSVAAAAGSSAGVGLTPVGGMGVALPRRERPGGERERSLTSMSVASSVAVGVPEEELQVGESAASSGLKP